MTGEEPGAAFDDDWDPDGWVTGDDWEEDPSGSTESGGSGGTDDRIHEGLEHMQRAAREMIAASRALLDVAEELVEDPGAIGRLARMIGAAPRPVHRSGQDPPPSDDDDPPVQRIPIS